MDIEDAKAMIAGALRRVVGRRMLVRVGRYLSAAGRYDGPNRMDHNGELQLLRTFTRKLAGQRLTAWDVGANQGEWTIALLDACIHYDVRPTVHAFEPSSGNAALLRKRLRTHPLGSCVIMSSAGVSDHVGEVDFYDLGAGAGSSSFYRGAWGAELAQPVRVIATTIDDYCRWHGISHIDLIKIDAEGHDMFVLEGGRELFASGSVGLTQFEYNARWILGRRYLRDAFIFANQVGYVLGKVTPDGMEFYECWHPELETFREGNYVLIMASQVGDLPSVKWWNVASGRQQHAE